MRPEYADIPSAEWNPMTSEYQIGCPECYMSCGLNTTLSKSENEFKCTTNPMHKFKMGTDGFLKSF